MANPYAYSPQYQQYSPPPGESQMNMSPIFPSMQFGGNSSTLSLLLLSTTSSVSSNYLLHNPRLRYYLLKLFDAEDDLEFCPEIPEFSGSPTIKKFNPYTALVFSPTSNNTNEASLPLQSSQQSTRVHTPRAKKIIEIVNPHTKLRVGSPAAK